MPMYTGAYRRMPMYTGACRRMPTHADVCRRMPAHAYTTQYNATQYNAIQYNATQRSSMRVRAGPAALSPPRGADGERRGLTGADLRELWGKMRTNVLAKRRKMCYNQAVQG